MPRPTAVARAGTLYVVATPIGNLDDITLRALNVLKTVSLVAAEDTRRTGILLRHYDIRTPILSVHEHNERGRASSIIAVLAAAESVALVTDAGTPAVSDPGALLVAAVREAGFRIEPIPGASAVLAALSASGLTSEGFTFLGFPPIRLNNRNKWVKGMIEEARSRAVVFFEAPHRIQKTLLELAELVERPIMIARELTKLHEEIRFGRPEELAEAFADARGEFTVILPPDPGSDVGRVEMTDTDIVILFGQITSSAPSLGRREAIRAVAQKLGRSAKDIYASLERSKLG